MFWTQDKRTGYHHAIHGERKIRIQPGFWGNSTDKAWKVWIDGNDHGTELTLRDAKLEAEREIKLLGNRAGF